MLCKSRPPKWGTVCVPAWTAGCNSLSAPVAAGPGLARATGCRVMSAIGLAMEPCVVR
jgi:hypothetical protein